jgi:hypothetical protein
VVSTAAVAPATAAGIGKMVSDPTALFATVVALPSAPGASNAPSAPLRESGLALLGRLLVLGLETATTGAPRSSSPLETNLAILIGPGPLGGMSRDLPPTGLAVARSARGPDTARGGARPAARGGTPWEDFILGLDQDFDRFRRSFREQRPAPAEPNARDPVAASQFNQRQATDQVLPSRGPKDAALSGDKSRAQLPDPEESKPIEVSLSGVALALAAGCAWMRRQRRKRRT